MRLALVVLVGIVGIAATIFAAVRMYKANKAGAPRELVFGYLALMVVASVVSLLVLRVL